MSAPSWRQARARCSPCSVSASTTTCVHASPRAASRGQQPVGQPLGRERRLVDTFRGRVQLADLDQIRRWHGERGRVLFLAAREPVRGRCRRDRSGRAPTAGGSAANAPSVRRPRRHEHARRAPRRPAPRPTTARGTPGSRPAGRRRRAGPRAGPRTHRRRCPHARPRLPSASNASSTFVTERVVTTEVARRAPGGEREHPGPVDHQPGREHLDRARHRLERARVGRRVELHDGDPRAPGLGLAPPQPRADLLGPRLPRRREHPAGSSTATGTVLGRLPATAAPRPPASPGTTAPASGSPPEARPSAGQRERGVPTVCTPRRDAPALDSAAAAARGASTPRPASKPGPRTAFGPEPQRGVGRPVAGAPTRVDPSTSTVLRSRARATSRRASRRAQTPRDVGHDQAHAVEQRGHHRRPAVRSAPRARPRTGRDPPRTRPPRARRGVPGKIDRGRPLPGRGGRGRQPERQRGHPRARLRRRRSPPSPAAARRRGAARRAGPGTGRTRSRASTSGAAAPGHLVEVGAGHRVTPRQRPGARGASRMKSEEERPRPPPHCTEHLFDSASAMPGRSRWPWVGSTSACREVWSAIRLPPSGASPP